MELVEGDTDIEQQFVLTSEGDAVDLSDATEVTWFSFRRPDDSGSTASDTATVLSSAHGFCSVILGADHMDNAGIRLTRVRVRWDEFTQDQWYPSDRALEVTILPHTRIRA